MHCCRCKRFVVLGLHIMLNLQVLGAGAAPVSYREQKSILQALPSAIVKDPEQARNDLEMKRIQRELHASRGIHYKKYHADRQKQRQDEGRKMRQEVSGSETRNGDEVEQNASRQTERILEREHSIFQPAQSQRAADSHRYVNAQSGNDSNNGASSSSAVKSLSAALALVKSHSRPLTGNLIVHLYGTFERERLVLNGELYAGTSSSKQVIFRGSSDGSTRILGGNVLTFIKVNELDTNHPARVLAELTGASLGNLYAAPPPADFPGSNDSNLKWRDSDCRDDAGYASPPLLSIDGRVLTRAREPNLPDRTASFDEDSMGQVLDTWLRTRTSNKAGSVCYKSSDADSVNKASNTSWSESVTVHMFPLVDWYDARVGVGSRAGNSCFTTDTEQKAPGNPDGGDTFRIAAAARYYFEGAVEYLDAPGEYHTSLGEVVEGSRGWTLLFPPIDIDMNSASAVAVLSMVTAPIIKVDGDEMYVSFENLAIEGARRYFAKIDAGRTDFYKCSFINAGRDGIEVHGENNTFRNCIFEGMGGRAISFSDSRDIDSDEDFAFLDSGNAIVDSLISDFASTCRHYSEALSLGGYGNIIVNNHFRSSNMAAIDIALGGRTQILHNVFSHISDGSYDDGAIHWVAESPMERGNEVAYNVFFRNGVSNEPCNAETSCYQADIYMDDMAGAMTIHGNVFIKDKVDQTAPTSTDYAEITWAGILINGGADVTVYENAFLGPSDGSTNGAIYNDRAAFFVQTCGGTIWPDGNTCGHTGVCFNDDFYKTMRQYSYDTGPWVDFFPELAEYDAAPASGSDWRCANTRSCPMASWNNTVICNSGVGTNRDLSHRAIWPSDLESSQKDEAAEGLNVPPRKDALKEYGNKAGGTFLEDIDVIEDYGMISVLQLAKRIGLSAEAVFPSCNEGSRRGATRSDLAGRNRNACSDSWALNGIASCDPCTASTCAARDMPSDEQCSCGVDDAPPSTQAPAHVPTKPPIAPVSSLPTQAPAPVPTKLPSPTTSCDDSHLSMKVNKKGKRCAWVAKNQSKRCEMKFVKSHCPALCDISFCSQDSQKKFKIKESGKWKKCNWVERYNTEFRCAFIGVAETCRATCSVYYNDD